MGVEGIGARVARKEDKRFLTGKGRYTDDMVVPGMKYGYFVRSSHAHAKIKSIDVSAAKAMPGVIDVLDGKQLLADGIGNLICGWMIHSKDGSPMKMGAWRPLAAETVRYVGDAVAIVVADSLGEARDAAEAVTVEYEELPSVVEAVDALKAGSPQLHPEAPNNLIFDWELGDGCSNGQGDFGGGPRHGNRDHEQPPCSRMPWSRGQPSGSTTPPKITSPATRRARTRMSRVLS